MANITHRRMHPLKTCAPRGLSEVRCCSNILTDPDEGIGLLRRGVLWDLMQQPPGAVEWSSWLPPKALNARQVITTYLPSLVRQSVWQATTVAEMTQSFRSILMGVGALNYPDSLWKPLIKRLLLQLRLSDILPISLWESWVVLGQQWSQIWVSGVID